MSVRPSKSIRPRQRPKSFTSAHWILLLAGSLFATCICSILFWVGLDTFIRNSPTQDTNATLPEHKVNALIEKPNDATWIMIVVDKDFPESDARKLVDYYEGQYSNAGALAIDMFCDDLYATAENANDPFLVPEDEYYAHILYSYLRPFIKEYTTFHSYGTNPFTDTQGSACK